MNKSDLAASGTGASDEWRILTEFALTSAAGSEQAAVANVAEALARFHGSSRTGDRFPSALGLALGESLRRRRRGAEPAALLVRVLIPCGDGEPAPERAELLVGEAQPANLAASAAAVPGQAHACGFFLVDRSAGSSGETAAVTDVYLYVEGGQRGSTGGPYAKA